MYFALIDLHIFLLVNFYSMQMLSNQIQFLYFIQIDLYNLTFISFFEFLFVIFVSIILIYMLRELFIRLIFYNS